jgi:hypothetical protein
VTTLRGLLIEVMTLDAEAKKMSSVVAPWWAWLELIASLDS